MKRNYGEKLPKNPQTGIYSDRTKSPKKPEEGKFRYQTIYNNTGCYLVRFDALGMFGVVDAEVLPVRVQSQHSAHTVPPVDAQFPAAAQGQLEHSPEPLHVSLHTEVREHQGFVPGTRDGSELATPGCDSEKHSVMYQAYLRVTLSISKLHTPDISVTSQRP